LLAAALAPAAPRRTPRNTHRHPLAAHHPPRPPGCGGVAALRTTTLARIPLALSRFSAPAAAVVTRSRPPPMRPPGHLLAVSLGGLQGVFGARELPGAGAPLPRAHTRHTRRGGCGHAARCADTDAATLPRAALSRARRRCTPATRRTWAACPAS
jgi:hypothetical protein